jgi:hypothetical protein
VSFAVTTRVKIYILVLVCIGLARAAQALPLTHFVPNSTGGFDAFVFPESLDGTPAKVSAIFKLPQTVNAGYVIILGSGTEDPRDMNNWSDVIHFFNKGRGKSTAMQMLQGGPDQASYFPSLSTIRHNPTAVIVEAQNSTNFTAFTDYSVRTKKKTRNYHFFTAEFSAETAAEFSAETAAIPESGSTLILLGVALASLLLLRRHGKFAI